MDTGITLHQTQRYTHTQTPNKNALQEHLPTTAKIRVLVKCRYKESFTTFLRSFKSFVVWERLM